MKTNIFKFVLAFILLISGLFIEIEVHATRHLVDEGFSLLKHSKSFRSVRFYSQSFPRDNGEYEIKYGFRGKKVVFKKNPLLIGIKPRISLHQLKGEGYHDYLQPWLGDEASNFSHLRSLGGFEIIEHKGARSTNGQSNLGWNDRVVNNLRKLDSLEVVTHIYSVKLNGQLSGSDEYSLVPDGNIYVEFSDRSSSDDRRKILAEQYLEIIGTIDQNRLFVKVTQRSPNPFKVSQILQENELVKTAEPDFPKYAIPGGGDPQLDALVTNLKWGHDLFKLQWNLNNANVVKSWAHNGFGLGDIIVSIIDNGFDLRHPSFGVNNPTSRVWSSIGLIPKIVHTGNFNTSIRHPGTFVDNVDFNATYPFHGTGVAGIAVGGFQGKTLGVAPNVRCLPMIYDRKGVSDFGYKSMIDWALIYGADIINQSWFFNYKLDMSSAMWTTIHDASTTRGRNGKGCIFVQAAGNHNKKIDRDTTNPVAMHPDVIVVAASMDNDQRAPYSNYGPQVWLCAPSSGLNDVITPDPLGKNNWKGAAEASNPDYGYVGQTSAAAPVVSGVVALMLSVNKNLTSMRVKEILRDTARKIGDEGYIDDGNGNTHSDYYGYGCVDAYSAVTKARVENVQ